MLILLLLLLLEELWGSLLVLVVSLLTREHLLKFLRSISAFRGHQLICLCVNKALSSITTRNIPTNEALKISGVSVGPERHIRGNTAEIRRPRSEMVIVLGGISLLHSQYLVSYVHLLS